MEEITKDNLTVEEKIALVSGTDFMFTSAVERLGIPALQMSDGPNGLRKQTENRDVGMSKSAPATAFPSPSTMANSWSRSLLNRVGEAIANECKAEKVGLLLGPGINIKRNPLSGRNFEYYSEDPHLAGELAVSFVNGVQQNGVGVAVKHFALNNSENFRAISNSVCDERTMREIYLKPFEKVITRANPQSVMVAYNKINSVHCSENEWLVNDVLRKEWGYEGAVITDWGAMHDRVKSLKAGVDIEMPGDTPICKRQIRKALKKGELSEEVLSQCAQRVVSLADKFDGKSEVVANFEAHNNLASVVAQESAVLLKNDGTLPLKPDQKLCIVGDLFEKMRYQGAGSSMLNPTVITTPKDAFDKNKIAYEYARGYEENSCELNNKLLMDAMEKAEKSDVVVIFAGLTDYVEFEGCDRESMHLQESQVILIDRLISLGKKTVVVLFGGAPVSLPFADSVNSILNMFLPGQNGGTATYNLLFGKENPSGRLAQSWAKNYEDIPFGAEFSKTDTEVYKEGLFVGYRYFTGAKTKPMYPFGFGLSYTVFDYSETATVRRNGNRIGISCQIVNKGEYKGKETVQLYARKKDSAIIRPDRELIGFRQISLDVGESRKAEIMFNEQDLAIYDVLTKKWVVEGGEYEFMICSDSATVKASVTLEIKGEKVVAPYSDEVKEKYNSLSFDGDFCAEFEQMSGLKIPQKTEDGKITLESRFCELRKTYWGRVIYNAVMKEIAKDFKKQGDSEDKLKQKLFTEIVINNSSIIQMTMSKANMFHYNYAEAVVHLANGRLFSALFKFLANVK